METSHALWWPCFWWIKYGYFCRGSPSDHFYQIIFNSDHWFQSSKFPHRYKKETGHAPWRPCFWRVNFVLAIIVVRHSVTVSTKLFCILTTGFRGEDLQSFCYRDKPRPLAAMFSTDQISFSYFCRGSPKEHSREIWLKLAKWHRRSCHLNRQIVDDARRRTTTHNSRWRTTDETEHFVFMWANRTQETLKQMLERIFIE